MSYVVIAYPDISQKNFEWIQSVRQKNDPAMFNVVKPHVTFIFPTSKLDINSLIEHVRTQISGFKSVTVNFDSTKVVEDDSKTYFHTFLVPSEGFDEIIQLHDKLHTDELKSELRLDIPFIPHLGIGTNEKQEPMQTLAKDIAKQNLAIQGKLTHLTVVEYANNKVKDIAKLPLVVDFSE